MQLSSAAYCLSMSAGTRLVRSSGNECAASETRDTSRGSAKTTSGQPEPVLLKSRFLAGNVSRSTMVELIRLAYFGYFALKPSTTGWRGWSIQTVIASVVSVTWADSMPALAAAAAADSTAAEVEFEAGVAAGACGVGVGADVVVEPEQAATTMATNRTRARFIYSISQFWPAELVVTYVNPGSQSYPIRSS